MKNHLKMTLFNRELGKCTSRDRKNLKGFEKIHLQVCKAKLSYLPCLVQGVAK